MLSAYRDMFEMIQKQYPARSRKMIEGLIMTILSFYTQYYSLAVIEIMDHLYQYREDSVNQERLADIYEKYSQTNFLVKNLKENDMRIIKERYIQELKNLGKEFGCAF